MDSRFFVIEIELQACYQIFARSRWRFMVLRYSEKMFDIFYGDCLINI